MKKLLFVLLTSFVALPLAAQVNKAKEIRSGGIQFIDGNDERPVSTYKRLTFWINTTSHGKVKVYLNNHYIGTITRSYSSAPKCGAAGCVTYGVDRTPSTWNGIAEDGTVFVSNPVTFHTGCNTIWLYPTSKKRRTSGSSGSGSTGGSSGYSSSSSGGSSSPYYTEEDREWVEDTGRKLGNMVGMVLSSGRGWDTRCNRIDLGVGYGIDYGGVGVKLNYQAPVVFGVTVGWGYNPSYDASRRDDKKYLWNAGLQLWCTDHWNFEIGIGPRYFKEYDDTQLGVSVMTHYQHLIVGRLGVIGGIGGSLSTSTPEGVKKGDVQGRFEWNVGLVFRLLK